MADDYRCGCGHGYTQHRGSFSRGGPTSCDRCIHCRAFHPRSVPLTSFSVVDLLGLNDEPPSLDNQT